MILPASQRHLLLPQGRGWKQYRVNRPSEKHLQKYVVSVLSYPIGLLLGEPRCVLLFLAARYGLRLSEMAGAIRCPEGWKLDKAERIDSKTSANGEHAGILRNGKLVRLTDPRKVNKVEFPPEARRLAGDDHSFE